MTPRTAPTVLEDSDYARFRELVRSRIGVEIPDVRRGDLERAVGEALVTTGLETPEQLYRSLTGPQNGEEALAAMIPTLTVGETHFFRNRPQIEALERQILPELIERARGTRRLRIWSAGCSTGEEPYTIAILLDRALPDLAEWDIRILGTDIDDQALEKARRGSYRSWSFREVPPEVKERYFRAEGDRMDLDERLRRMVTFKELNLISDRYPSPETGTDRMDLVLCRNVLIYFRMETTRAVVSCMHSALVPGGWLVVGHVEPSQDVFVAFAELNLPGTISYQKLPP